MALYDASLTKDELAQLGVDLLNARWCCQGTNYSHFRYFRIGYNPTRKSRKYDIIEMDDHGNDLTCLASVARLSSAVSVVYEEIGFNKNG